MSNGEVNWNPLDDPRLASYVVDDLTDHLQCGSRCAVLLCESPHTKEVCAGHPLAGESGRTVAKAFGRTDPIGRILRDCNFGQCELLPCLGVMNVSRLPMQKGPYCSSLRNLYWDCLLKPCKTIRGGPSEPRRRDCRTKRLEEALKCDLQQRVDVVRQRHGSIKFITCGTVAKAFLEKIELTNLSLCHVSHPASRLPPNKWFDTCDQPIEKVCCMLSALREHVNGS